MTLRDWEQTNRWLVAHRTTREEIGDLLAVGDRDLRDSRVAALSADARLGLAYTAALQFASAALAAAGYRPTRGGDHHYRTIQALTLTIGWDAKQVKRLDTFRSKRNTSAYERAGEVSDAEAREIQDMAERLRDDGTG
jgi:hypothetical protein